MPSFVASRTSAAVTCGGKAAPVSRGRCTRVALVSAPAPCVFGSKSHLSPTPPLHARRQNISRSARAVRSSVVRAEISYIMVSSRRHRRITHFLSLSLPAHVKMTSRPQCPSLRDHLLLAAEESHPSLAVESLFFAPQEMLFDAVICNFI
jgi:hypothetical protein